MRTGADKYRSLDISDEQQILRAIGGALKSAIDAHGPVTDANRSHAMKRTYGVLKSLARDQVEFPPGKLQSGGSAAVDDSRASGLTVDGSFSVRDEEPFA